MTNIEIYEELKQIAEPHHEWRDQMMAIAYYINKSFVRVKTMSESSDKLKSNADEFVKKCHVMPIVHALEGGVIELEKLLIDFVKYNKENA